MITALDADAGCFDQQERRFVSNIREHGWFCTNVASAIDEEPLPNFSYTTGFWLNTSQPELIVFSLKNDIAHDIFWELYRDAQAGNARPLATPVGDLLQNLPVYFFPVAERFYAEHLGWTSWFYSKTNPFPCLQIVWPDRSGRFPWEAGFDVAFSGDQPDLTENGWLAELER